MKSRISCFFLILMIIEVHAWNPPIGIPAPSFGIEETYRMYDDPANRNPELAYTQNAEGGYYTYYIDNTHPNATDVDNPYGSSSKPRKSIPKNPSLTVGNVLQIQGGTYDGNLGNIWTLMGTDAQPVFIRGSDSVNKPVLTKFQLELDGSYFIIENVDFYNNSYMNSYNSAHHFAIRNCEIHNHPDSTVEWGKAIGAQGSDIVIYRNHIHHNWTNSAVSEGDCHGVRPGQAAKNIWIVDNDIHHNSGDAIQACHACNPAPRYIYIGRNQLHEDKENGVDLKYADDVIISQNTIYGYYSSSTSIGGAVLLGSDGAPNRVWVLFNEIYDSENGIRNEESYDAWIIGNIIRDIEKSGIRLEKRADNLHVINNVIYNMDMGIKEVRENFRVRIHNNIFSSFKSSTHINIASPSTVNLSELGHNLFWQDGQSLKIKWGNEYTYGPTEGIINFPHGTGNRVGNPLFTNPTQNDFRLNAESPAIDAGVAHSVYDTFQLWYNIGIKTDFDNKTRPNGSGWDMGAFEYGSVLSILSSGTPHCQNALSVTGYGGVFNILAPVDFNGGSMVVRLYGIDGRIVKQKRMAVSGPGRLLQISLDGQTQNDRLTSGVYFLEIDFGRIKNVQKAVIMR